MGIDVCFLLFDVCCFGFLFGIDDLILEIEPIEL